MITRHLPITCVTPDDDGQYFFGYFDKCPYRPTPREDGVSPLLAHRARFLDRFPEAHEPVEIGVVDPVARKFRAIALSHAWNWQQGAHAQWLPDGRVLYNDRRDNRPVAVIADESGHEQAVLPMPALAVSRDGRLAASVSMGRLTRLRREYGLPGLTDAHADDPAPADDGLWMMDVERGTAALIVPLAELGSHGGGSIPHHQHVNHALFNPSGSRLCFLHRYERDDGITQSRLFTVAPDGADLRLLMEGMVSHYDWIDDSSILAWAGKRGLIAGGATAGRASPKQLVMTAARRTLKPVYYALGKPRFLMNKILKDSYLVIPDEADAETEVFARGELITDGHCTLSPDAGDGRRWVLTDGYPDMKGRQPLYLWDRAHDLGYEIGRYPTPRHLDGETRVDLHPRFDRTGLRACFDSAMDGRRRMYEVDLSGLVSADRA